MPVPMIRTSERTAFKACRQRWWWQYVEGLRPKVSGPALRFGTLAHAALEARYPKGVKRGPSPAKTFGKLYEEETAEAERFGWRDEEGKWLEAGALGVALLGAFVDEFGNDERYEVIASEQTFITPFIDSRGKHVADYVGTVDGVWQDRTDGAILFCEWKTAAQIWSQFLMLDEQAGAYWTFAPEWLQQQGYLDRPADLRGVLYTFLRKAMPDDRPRNADGLALNKDGTVSRRQQAPLFHRELVYRSEADREMVRQRTEAELREMRLIRAGKLSVYKTPGQRTCMGCSFRDMCELHEAGADWELIRDATMETCDPYEAHQHDEKESAS